MEIISTPDLIEETVVDFEVAYLNGVWSRTLHSGDNVFFGHTTIEVRTLNPNEITILTKAQILGHTLRERVIKRKKEKA